MKKWIIESKADERGWSPRALERMPSWFEWRVHGKYKTEKSRDQALAALQRKGTRWLYRKGEDDNPSID